MDRYFYLIELVAFGATAKITPIGSVIYQACQETRIMDFQSFPKPSNDPQKRALQDLANQQIYLDVVNLEFDVLKGIVIHHWEDRFSDLVLPLLLNISGRYRRLHRLRLHYLPLGRVFLNYSDPNHILPYPLLGVQLCTKGLWFPILSSLVKVSLRKVRTAQKKLIAEQNMAPEPKTKPKTEAEELGLKICLVCTQSMFENRQTLPERTFDKVMDTTKKVLGRSQRDAGVRSVTFPLTGKAS